MKDDWIRDEYLEVKPILLYVKRKKNLKNTIRYLSKEKMGLT